MTQKGGAHTGKKTKVEGEKKTKKQIILLLVSTSFGLGSGKREGQGAQTVTFKQARGSRGD